MFFFAAVLFWMAILQGTGIFSRIGTIANAASDENGFGDGSETDYEPAVEVTIDNYALWG